ncbi:MFS transporter [Pseudidiomarina sp. E22-M8]|uniref:MFS transporter n=1 Tax=Pseudidiomarina sp. E22-M8 TaxID=3424768 RepID=UPI00403C5CB8
MPHALATETVDKITALHVIASTAIWMCWSVLVVLLYALDLGFTIAELFGLLALTGFSAAGFQLLWFGLGERALQPQFIRRTTILLLLPALGFIYCFTTGNYSLVLLRLLAIACGIGGAQLYVRRRRHVTANQSMGWDLAVTASIGGIGIVLAQIGTPFVALWQGPFATPQGAAETTISIGTLLGSVRPEQNLWLSNLGWFTAFVVAGLMLVNVLRRPRARAYGWRSEQPTRRYFLRNPHTWVMTLLYIMAFGSFIGFALAFPLILQFLFGFSREWQGGELIRVMSNDYAPQALTYAWLGPLIGVVARPLGGWLADQYGGSRVTMVCALVLAVASLTASVLTDKAYHSGAPEHYFLLFLLTFFVLFAVSALASSAIYRSASVLFPTNQLGIALRWLAACATAGAGYIPLMWGVQSYTATPSLALVAFAIFYALCAAIVATVYLRRHSVYFNP